MQQSTLLEIASWIIPLVFAIVFHEIAHGWTAYAFGDPTAKEKRRLSPNPIRHIDPFGTLVLPMILVLAHAPVFGWAKPVLVDEKRLHNPRIQMMLVALAGPGMNFLLAFAAAAGLALATSADASPFLVANLRNFLVLNVFLAVFNLMPIPPFDGGHVVEGLLPRPLAAFYRRLWPFAFPLVIILLVVLPMIAPRANIVGALVVPPVMAILDLYGAIFG
jgi:Zn-dependent protease